MQIDSRTIFTLVGHLSFILSATAYLMTDIVKLRAIAICSGLAGLVYNSTLAGGPLWLVVFWLLVFLVINSTRLARVIADRMEVTLPAEQRALLIETFPSMHSRDWLKLTAVGQLQTVSRGDTLLSVGDHTDAVCILAKGQALESRADGSCWNRSPSAMSGELSYVTHSQFDGSPCSITVISERAEVLRLPYQELSDVTRGNERLRAALMEGFVRTAGLKHGLMRFEAADYPTGGATMSQIHRHIDGVRRQSFDEAPSLP